MRWLVNAGMWLVVGLVVVSVALEASGVEGVSALSTPSSGGKGGSALQHTDHAAAAESQGASPSSSSSSSSLLQTSAQAHTRSMTRARMRLVEVSANGGAGLDVSPHFRFSDSTVDSELLDELNNMLIQTQARAVREKCQLLGNWFGYLVQATLGVIAFSALIVKKYMDSKPRDWPTWIRDTSKQAIGSIAAHFWNLLFATLLQSKPSEDPCVYYLINYLVDAVLGCILSLLMLWGFDSMADKYDWEMLRSGDYGSANDQPTVWKRWAAQLSLWVGIITISKLFLLFAFIVPAKAPLYVAGAWMMSGLVNYPRWELVIVMIIIPLVLNVVQFWIQDNFLMDHATDANHNTHKFHAVPTHAPPPPPHQPQPPTATASAAPTAAAVTVTIAPASAGAGAAAAADNGVESRSLLASN